MMHGQKNIKLVTNVHFIRHQINNLMTYSAYSTQTRATVTFIHSFRY